MSRFIKDFSNKTTALRDFLKKKIQLFTDESNNAIRGILLQKEGVGIKPVYYVSRPLTAAELKYSITEKEAFALVWAIEKLHLYLCGKNFKVVVDDKPLKFIFSSSSKLNARIARWEIKLQAYDFDIIYKKRRREHCRFYIWKLHSK